MTDHLDPADAWAEFDRRTGFVPLPLPPVRESSIDHVNGIEWQDAPTPHRWHRCKPQTVAFIAERGGWHVERCACGAIRHDRGGWLNRNSKRP